MKVVYLIKWEVSSIYLQMHLPGTRISIAVTKEIKLSELGTSIGNSAYKDATIIKVWDDEEQKYVETTELDLSGTSLTTIGNYAFASCKSLTKVTLPNTITSIGTYAFCGCSNLTTINIPQSVSSLGTYAFGYCSSLTSVTFDESSVLTVLSSSLFRDCSSLQSISLPSSVVKLDSYAFIGCSKLNTINLENITNFGYDCMGGCKLTSINLSSNITNLSDLALYNCLSRDTSYSFTITIPNTVTTCGIRVLEGNERLKIVNWYANLDNIPERTFCGDSGLTTVNLPSNYSSLKTINAEAFRGCSSLTTINNLPLVNTKDEEGRYINNVTKIGNNAFYNCKNLTGSFWIRSDVFMDEDEAFKGIESPKYTIKYFNVDD